MRVRISKSFTAIILLMALIITIFAGMDVKTAKAAGKPGYVTAQTGLRVRKAPGTTGTGCEPLTYVDGPKKGQELLLDNMQSVTILAETNDSAGAKWYYITVKLEGVAYKGYSLAQYIKESDGTEVTPTVKPTKAPTPTETPTEAPTEAPTAVPTAEPTAEPADPTPTAKPTKAPTEAPEEPKGETETETVKSTEFPGTVTASVLTLRKNAGTDKKQLTTLSRDTKVSVIGAKLITVNGVKQRWYMVRVKVDKKEKTGYVLSDYVCLDLPEPTIAKSRLKSIAVYKKASTSSGKLKTAKGAVIKLGKAKKLTLVSETTVEGVKWFEISFKYGGKVKKGYVKALNLKLVSTTVTKKITPPPTKAPTPTPDPNLNKPTEEPAPTPSVSADLAGANALIKKDAAALPVKQEASYTSATLMTPASVPVTLYAGQSVEFISSTVSGGVTWAYIRFLYDGAEYYGYIGSFYIENAEELGLLSSGDAAAASGLSFEDKLSAEGFPDSYKQALRELHAHYPNWQFTAYHTGLDWSTVITEENTPGRNTIPNSKSIEWKSLANKAYNWKTDTFIVFDGSTWVSASKEAIEYYMDPRNFLTAENIFQFEVLTYSPSYQKKDGVEKVLKNTAMYGTDYSYRDELGADHTISYADTFMMAAEYSGVSPFHLASRVKQEVTLGPNALSNSVSGTVAGYEGLYNFYNIGANDSTVPGGNIANGLRFASKGPTNQSLKINCLIPWDNRYRSILGGSYYIGYNYINRGQDTIYLQKFNVTENNTYIHQYMTNVEAPYSEGRKVYNAYENPEDIAIVFKLPVYENMPETPCPYPEKAYNPNNWLASLSILDENGKELALTPSFAVTKDQEYDLIVESDVELISIEAKTVSKLAKVITGPFASLEKGLNVVTVSVEAENGEIRDYIINVVREE